MNRPLSSKIYQELCEVLPAGVDSPVRSFSRLGISPMVVASGNKSILTDVDGNKYIDYCNSWGALILGHAHPDIISSVTKQMSLGTSFGITTEIEGKLARKIMQFVPSVEKLRFVSSGTEATMSAVRLARGYTGRNIIVKFSGHYHGHADFFLVQAGSGLFENNRASSSLGIPDDIVKNTLCIPFNDQEALIAIFNKYKDQIAAVIIEPVAGNMGVVPAEASFMQLLREITEKNQSLLIFDEVITGFRVSLNGAQSLYRIKPDLTCFGKIIGGGFPAAAFGGRREIMDYLAPLGKVYQAGTLSGNPVAMQAGLTTLLHLESPDTYKILKEKADRLLNPIRQIIEERDLNLCIQQVGSMFTLFFGAKKITCAEDGSKLDTEKFASFFRYLFERGVYIAPAQFEASFISLAHTDEELDQTSSHIINYLVNY